MNKHHLPLLLLVTCAALAFGACADQITNESYYSTHNHYYDAPPNGDDDNDDDGDDAGADVPDDDNGGDNNGGDNNGGGDRNNVTSNNEDDNGGDNNSDGDNSDGGPEDNNGGTATEDFCDPDGDEVCDDGADNDCDGMVDEGCTCTVAEKSCYSSDPSTAGVGRCLAGVQRCEGEFYGDCEGEVTPSEELCDGIDNDCDGQADEDWPELGQACSDGAQTCASQGLYVCTTGGRGVICEAQEVVIGAEICDGLDNDCDGSSDEDFLALGQPCTVGLGACANTGVTVCSPDGTGALCGAQPSAPNEERCDGLDNNCNGLVDENFPTLGQACEAGVGLCARPGVFACGPNGELLCDAAPGAPSAEICDGLDNDCNGQTDELPECSNQGPQVTCPPDFNAAPLDTITLAGLATDANNDPLTYRWELVNGPIGTTTTADPGNLPIATAFLDLAGEFEFRFTATDPLGQSSQCTTRVNAIPSERLRVEMLWNIGAANDPTDVDLHMLAVGDGGWISNADCNFRNCTPGRNLEWGAPGSQDNPRLDIDDTDGNGPENINIDFPQDRTYRVGVHYWADDGFGPSTVTIRVYCLARLVREFEPVTIVTRGGSNAAGNDFWTVADIVWSGNNCTVNEFGAPGARDIRQSGEVF
jgi:hypothetical protein